MLRIVVEQGLVLAITGLMLGMVTSFGMTRSWEAFCMTFIPETRSRLLPSRRSCFRLRWWRVSSPPARDQRRSHGGIAVR